MLLLGRRMAAAFGGQEVHVEGVRYQLNAEPMPNSDPPAYVAKIVDDSPALLRRSAVLQVEGGGLRVLAREPPGPI